MAATVDQTPGKPVNHADAVKLQVHDGHLHLLNARQSTVAVYAPGAWRAAQLDTAAKE